ncbi:unnamed protein product [Lactuca saligna]|uniref:Uncharacterized protein n=1 Tax=Lactuca saligna TaxID=75948 RepID=A0AA36EB49_LACSI|nr:unnamed protein product [Lactuca saligna]
MRRGGCRGSVLKDPPSRLSILFPHWLEGNLRYNDDLGCRQIGNWSSLIGSTFVGDPRFLLFFSFFYLLLIIFCHLLLTEVVSLSPSYFPPRIFHRLCPVKPIEIRLVPTPTSSLLLISISAPSCHFSKPIERSRNHHQISRLEGSERQSRRKGVKASGGGAVAPIVAVSPFGAIILQVSPSFRIFAIYSNSRVRAFKSVSISIMLVHDVDAKKYGGVPESKVDDGMIPMQLLYHIYNSLHLREEQKVLKQLTNILYIVRTNAVRPHPFWQL